MHQILFDRNAELVRQTNRLVHLLLVSQLMLSIILDGCAEESIDEGGLSQATLADDHYRESCASANKHNMSVFGLMPNKLEKLYNSRLAIL